MKLKLFLAGAFFLVFSGLSFAQQTKNISGTVTATDQVPLPGAEVKVIGKEIYDVTDFDGNFSLEGVEVGDTFRVTFLGFKAQEVEVTQNDTYSVVLEEDAGQLEEVVVVGYGSQRKQDLTGSISRVDTEEITRQPAASPMQSIQGRAAGVQITPSGAPGSTPDVFIRGLGTAFGGQNPLYVVDGILTDNIDNINPNDITNIDILKDASSLAIYGNRGANGVIIVSTKKGKAGALEISIQSSYGIKSELRKVEMADSRSFAIYSNEALQADGEEPRFDLNQEFNTDWFDEITRTGSISSNNLSITAGSEKVRTYFSAGYYEEEGILKGNDFNRLTLRSNTEFDIVERIKFSQQVSAALSDEIPKPFGAFNNAYKQTPIIPVRYPEGNEFAGKFGSSTGINNVGNPFRDLYYNNQQQKNLKLQGTFTIEADIAEWIDFTSRFGIETEYFRSRSFVPNLDLFLSGDPTRTVDDYAPDSPKNTLTVTKNNNYRWVLDNFVTLNHTLDDAHNFKLTLGTTVEELLGFNGIMNGEYLRGTRYNVPRQSDFWYLNNGDEEPQLSEGRAGNLIRLNSYFARVNYDYKSKYLLTGTFRRDGSSQFQEGNKWGNFFSVGAGWVISEEAFLKDSETISFLKLRGSFGELGNQNVPLNILTFNTGLNYPFGPDESINEGGTINELIDPSLSWETTEEFDIGLEFGFWDNKLAGEIDYYNRLNRNAILPVELPDAFGFSGTTLTPAGEVVNEGVEISLNWSDNIGDDFSYSIGGNLTFNNNRLEKVTNEFFAENTGGSIGNGQITKKVVEGQPLGSFWLLDVTGVDENGQFIYDDVDNSGTINDADKKFFGAYTPKNFGGFNISANYKNWDFNLDGYGNWGNYVYNGKKANRFSNENIEQEVFDNRWTPENPSNTEPAPFNAVPLSSDYYLEKGDFLRINNITLGYTLPLAEELFIQNARVYFTAQNPVIAQAYSGYTPEITGGPLSNGGIELNAYPATQSFILGVNLSL
ncbi:TonB-dependent receptor [Pontixanthobacter gangjinensis]|uniref:TonB-dependent receptor n=1 Tax=Christiangramia aestuarii TaxID=1028746 RepID=A0A7K1LMD6_9FLAO|nr:TonB-dependent receptor [Christiangramia aestuarii]MUP41947.1 TonB-dependent receptor [Christiangramia aestuarii]